ncbi:MAG: A/G-specific adenine glycosylase [Candidatus Krumholzibacteriia bacterium]
MLDWYDRHGRDLPWRRRRSLYGTWISEIMLQQTTVAAVLPRWSAFLDRFPDVHALAAAPEADVLAAWSHLGYYRRARLLHQAARRIVADGGRLPSDLAGWRSLPGVGDYAAGAIASIGLGDVAAAVDANVRRVLTRWWSDSPGAAAGLNARRLQHLALQHLPPTRPGDWNEALMDLGATVCRTDQPRCGDCPVAAWCAAAQAGIVDQVPAPVKRVEPAAVCLGALVVRCGDRILVLPPEAAVVVRARGLGRPYREDLGGLLAGTLCVPLTPWYAGHLDDGQPFLAAWRAWFRSLGIDAGQPTLAGVVRHVITHHRLQVHVSAVTIDVRPPLGRWVEPTGDWPRSTLVARCLAKENMT